LVRLDSVLRFAMSVAAPLARLRAVRRVSVRLRVAMTTAVVMIHATIAMIAAVPKAVAPKHVVRIVAVPALVRHPAGRKGVARTQHAATNSAVQNHVKVAMIAVGLKVVVRKLARRVVLVVHRGDLVVHRGVLKVVAQKVATRVPNVARAVVRVATTT
jgi:hypothetical protein